MKNSIDPSLDNEQVQKLQDKPKSMITVGKTQKPFLYFILKNAHTAGYSEVIILINEKDEFTQNYFTQNTIEGLNITFAVQKIPKERSKPLGTADALMQALDSNPGWLDKNFTVCNSDNIYSENVFKLLLRNPYPNSMIDYDRDSLRVEPSRVQAFSVITKNQNGFLTEIIEKPNEEQVAKAMDKNRRVGVSMNIFSLSAGQIYPYLNSCPIHTERNEKELPVAIKNMIKDHPEAIYAIPVSEEVPDLTYKEDIKIVEDQLIDQIDNY